jgi:hypothetical protein
MDAPTFDLLGFLDEPGRPASGHQVAVMVATFDPPHDVRQVRTTGPARIEPRDLDRVRRLCRRYVDEWSPKWERQATAAGYRLWSMSPASGMAVAYPNLDDAPTFRWSHPAGLFGRDPDRVGASLRRFRSPVSGRRHRPQAIGFAS